MYGWLATLGLVFGGCCSNAISLEQLTSEFPQAGSLITFFQFILISLHGLPQHITWTSYGPRLAPTQIPISRYIIQVCLFYLISLLNNAAFAYDIPMSVHIIFRSGGLIVSLVLGYIVAGKRYNIHQVLSVLVVTIGVVCTTLSASPSQSTSVSSTYLTGIAILSLALILSGFLGLVQDWTYRQHTGASPWQESMFFLHFLALPMFVLLRGDISAQIQVVNRTPRAYIALLVNTLTQLVCVAGVNRLTTRVNALTVTLVLVVRKAVSLVLSVAFNGAASHVDMQLLWTGAAMVMGGTIWYSFGRK
ncbi:UAA transporter [Mucidula mucida]|nr:UAA transporter [Mucidula mucida]